MGAIFAGVIAGVVVVMAVVVFGIYRYCKTRKPSTNPDSEAAVIRRHHSSESSSKGLIDGGQQKFRRESKRFSYLEEANGVISVARSFESFVVEPKSLDGNEDDDDDDSNLYAEIQADEAEQRQDSRMGKDYDCLDFYRPNQQHRSHYHRSNSGLNSVGSLDFEKPPKK